MLYPLSYEDKPFIHYRAKFYTFRGYPAGTTGSNIHTARSVPAGTAKPFSHLLRFIFLEQHQRVSGQIRTGDHRPRKPGLYPLSYEDIRDTQPGVAASTSM
jgi:hypothetical protein